MKRDENLPALIDRRLILQARWDRLRDARLEETDDDDASEARWERLGALMARAMIACGRLDARIADALDRAITPRCYHRGWIVERVPDNGRPRPRLRLTGCPAAADVRQVWWPSDAEIDEAAAFAALEDLVRDGVAS